MEGKRPRSALGEACNRSPRRLGEAELTSSFGGTLPSLPMLLPGTERSLSLSVGHAA